MAYAYTIPITIADNQRVDAHVGDYLICTDQSRVSGGGAKFPSPFELLLASIGTAAGVAVQRYCLKHELASDAIAVHEEVSFDDAGDLASITIRLNLPPRFTKKHTLGVLHAATRCDVRRAIGTGVPVVVRAVPAPKANARASTSAVAS